MNKPLGLGRKKLAPGEGERERETETERQRDRDRDRETQRVVGAGFCCHDSQHP